VVKRQDAAYSAIKIAAKPGWQDHRRAFRPLRNGPRLAILVDAEAAHEQ